jgi:hypothetical protein
MSASGSVRHPSALALHEYQLGATPPPERAGVAAHLAACGRCRDELGALAADQRRFEQEVLPRTQPRHQPATRRWLLGSGLAAVTAAGALFWLGQRAPDIRAKGGEATLSVFAARGERVIAVEDGVTELGPGDRIRFVLRPGGFGYALIASVDGGGRATVYHPFRGERSVALPPGARVELPGSIVLDRSPGPERVFALLSRQPLAAADVLPALAAIGRRGPSAVRATSRLALPADAQGSVLFEKPVAAAP